MQIRLPHPWDLNYREAVACQNALRERIVLHDQGPAHPLRMVAGADISYARKSDVFFAAVVLLSYPEMEIIEEATAIETVTFPYIPGLLSFREGPALIKAWDQLHQTPDLVVFDGQGIAHPRGIGLASHMGLILDIPAIGCAKSVLVGQYAMPASAPGAWSSLIHEGRVVGVALRTRENVKPVFVSPGHRISMDRARGVIMGCCRGYRLPEPTRRAHLAVNRLRESMGARISQKQ